MAILAASARLLDELAFDFVAGLADGFAVRHLRLAHRGFDAELALHAVDQDFQMQLAHAGDDGLSGFLVGAHAEGGILLRQPAQRNAHLFLVGLGLGFHGLRDNGLGEHHAFQDDDVRRIGQRVASGDVLDADGRSDIARVDLGDLATLVGVHLQDAPQAFLFFLDGVEDRIAGFHHA
ncbi:hypothetical protein D3C72_924990 [compost metagenome]